MLQIFQEAAAMSRVPQPATFGYSASLARREPTPADYSDDICDENFEALKALVRAEADDEGFELVDGPAW